MTTYIQSPYQPEPKQLLAHLAKETEILYGGAMGGMKSVCLVNDGMDWLERQPGARGFLGRQVLKHLKISTLQTFREWIDPRRYQENKQEQCFHLPNGSQLFYGGLDSKESTDFLKSTEFSWMGFDQAEEIPQETYLMARARLRQKRPNGSHYRYRVISTANPKQCFLKSRFINPSTREADCVFIQALPKDNPHLPPHYLEDMRRNYRHRPELLQALIEGSWDDLLSFNTVIREEWVRQCLNRPVGWMHSLRHVSQDVARFGDDLTALYGWDVRRMTRHQGYAKKDLMATAAHGLEMVESLLANHWTIDEGGMGAGVVDRARQLVQNRPITVMGFNGGAASRQSQRFGNLRAEAWWEAGEILADGDACLMDDAQLVEDLTSATYYFDAKGRIFLTDKEEVKAQLGRSPDKGDACVMGLWASRHVPTPQPVEQGYRSPVGEPWKMETEQSDAIYEMEAADA